MRTSRLLPWVLIVVAVSLAAAGCGASKAKKKGKRTKSPTPDATREAPQPTAEGFVVVQVNGEARVVAQAELDSIRFELRSGYRDALRTHKQARKKAEAAGESFDAPKPPRPKIRISKRVFPTQVVAEAYRKKLLAKKRAGDALPAPVPGQPASPEGS